MMKRPDKDAVKVGHVQLRNPPFEKFSAFLASLQTRQKELYTVTITPKISEELYISFKFDILVNVWRSAFVRN